MANLAVTVEHALQQRERDGTPGQATAHVLARGNGWTVEDVVCTSGPHDRAFEERHGSVSIAIVAAGSFEYRSHRGHDLMTPGSLLLGSPGHCFECGHEQSSGDRCIAFHFSPDYFESVTGRRPSFPTQRIPAIRSLAPVIARACSALTGQLVEWEELGLQLAARTLDASASPASSASPSALRAVTRAIRRIESQPSDELTLASLAAESRLSSYHFLRTFEQVTGVTPHQYILRSRLRLAALRLATNKDKILDIALDCGFGDISNFNRTFRAEFGMSPRAYRRSA